MKNICLTLAGIITLMLFCFNFTACQQKEDEEETISTATTTSTTTSSSSDSISYGSSTYELKTYKVERHPTLVRHGFGMDIYHQGDAILDTLYLKSDSSSFQYDLLFWNEMAYTPLSTGDYTSVGYPVIFMYTDTINPDKSVKAVMVGQGITYFNSFTAYSITPTRIASLKADPYIDLSKYRTEVHTSTVDGSILLESTAESLYSTLVIGNKFRPNIGGVFNMTDVSDETQINYQPVFLVKTREGLYAKFMVTRFKGVGADVQKMTLQWQAIKK